MMLISHRGNLNGRSNRENHPDYIHEALNAGYYVELDVWVVSGSLFLGHDRPQYPVSVNFFQEPKLLCHAKNLEAFKFLSQLDVHYFWHQNDDYAMTSREVPISHPRSKLMPESIAMLPELNDSWTAEVLETALGICSDYIARYREDNDERVFYSR